MDTTSHSLATYLLAYLPHFQPGHLILNRITEDLESLVLKCPIGLKAGEESQVLLYVS